MVFLDVLLRRDVAGQPERASFYAQSSHEGFRAIKRFGATLENCNDRGRQLTRVILPRGWAISTSTPGLGREIRDGRGRLRGWLHGRGYQAIMELELWFTVRAPVYPELGTTTLMKIEIVDGDANVVHTILWTVRSIDDSIDVHGHISLATAEAETWLTQHYPKWRQLAAYWK